VGGRQGILVIRKTHSYTGFSETGNNMEWVCKSGKFKAGCASRSWVLEKISLPLLQDVQNQVNSKTQARRPGNNEWVYKSGTDTDNPETTRYGIPGMKNHKSGQEINKIQKTRFFGFFGVFLCRYHNILWYWFRKATICRDLRKAF